MKRRPGKIDTRDKAGVERGEGKGRTCAECICCKVLQLLMQGNSISEWKTQLAIEHKDLQEENKRSD